MQQIPKVDVCVCTYRRPESLARTLRSLVEMRADNFEFRIHVFDNDAEESARAVITSFQAVSYQVEPTRNLSAVRNRALTDTDGDFVAMVDDDEIVDVNWLSELMQVAQNENADIIVGRHKPVFGAVAPRWAGFSKCYHDGPVETGATSGFTLTTSNVLIRRRFIAQMSHWFDPRFGLTGGEDTEFLGRMVRLGAKSVYCREGVATEDFSSRTSLLWVAKRRIRIGSVSEAVNPQRVDLLDAIVKVLIWGMISPWWLIAVRFYPKTFIFQYESFWFHAGWLGHRLFGVTYQEYANPVAGLAGAGQR